MSQKKKTNKQKTTTYKDNLAEKKMTVLKDNRKNRTMQILTIAAILLVAGGAFAYLSLTPSQSSPPTATVAQSNPTASETTVSYPVSLFEDGKAHHFDYHAGDMTVKYFVLKSSDGVLRAAFDACDVCWPSGKGYYQEGDKMVCRNCGRKFASVKVNEVKGGCNPAPLDRTVQGDQLIIQVSDILQGQTYFDFSGKGTKT